MHSIWFMCGGQRVTLKWVLFFHLDMGPRGFNPSLAISAERGFREEALAAILAWEVCFCLPQTERAGTAQRDSPAKSSSENRGLYWVTQRSMTEGLKLSCKTRAGERAQHVKH